MSRDIPSKQKLIEEIIRGVCELPDYNSPDDQPELLQCTVQELDAILDRCLPDETGCSEELERLRKLEEHVERVACWINPNDVYREIRQTRDDIHSAREARRRAVKTSGAVRQVLPQIDKPPQ